MLGLYGLRLHRVILLRNYGSLAFRNAMKTIDFKDEPALQSLVTDEFSDWSPAISVTQEMIDQFAELTGDTLWIHTDPQRCAEQSPFGKTIAHGFLILSLLTKMPVGDDVTRKISGYKQIFNYGSDKLRFLAPVPVESEIRARNRVISVEVSERKTVVTLETQVSIVDAEQPSLLYQLSLVLM